MKKIISATIASRTLFCAPSAGAQNGTTDGKYSIKASAGIGLGKAYSASSNVTGVDLDKASGTEFGVDFRYRFWQNDKLSLGLNAGLSYSTGSMTMKADEMSFNYVAGAEADMDGDAYMRYTTLRDMSQKVTLGEFGVPVYVDLNWQLSRRFALYGEAGLGFRFSTTAKAKDLTGTCDVYGIYPQYDNLKIDDDWLNDFGDHSLAGTAVAKPEQNSFTMNLRVGAGLRLWIAGPLSLECGIRYNHGFVNRLKSGTYADGSTTASDAPMTYTVANGRSIKSLSSALDKSKLSNIALNVGLIVTF